MKNWYLFFKCFMIGYWAMFLISCCTFKGEGRRMFPHYEGVDPAMKSVVDGYLELAKSQGLKFDNTVSIGFTNTKVIRENVIGVCHLGLRFREIDIDQEYWNRSSATSRETLLRHELTHCYCGRGHDWADGKDYPEAGDNLKESDILPFDITIYFAKKTEGYFQDGECPLTIMHPYIVSDTCVRRHYAEYEKEMWERCEPF